MLISICAAFILLYTGAEGHGEVTYTEEALRDQVTDLPGLPAAYTANQFSGYVNVTSGSIFYWYVESQNNPSTAPIIWWTNGGPGCSGMNGFLEENGPFRPNKRGTLNLNPYAWNTNANMIFVEQPVGVGFSSANSDSIKYGDALAAKDNAMFISNFLARFPELKQRPFYLSSESYGGHYLPTLAKYLVENPVAGLDFQGFLVGNPLTYLKFRNYGQYATFWGHQLLPKPLWDSAMNASCFDEDSSACNKILDQMDEITRNLDPYALDFPVCTDDESNLRSGRHERHMMQQTISRANNMRQKRLQAYFPIDYQSCEDDYTTKYLNRADVQKAIHAELPPNGRWDVCSNTINANYNMDDVNAPMMPIWSELVEQNLNLMIYSGDDDSVCPAFGTQLFLWNMGWKEQSYWKEWKVNGQTAGFETVFTNGFVFKTVHGAGHMVPSTRPEQALALLTDFLAN